jgi:hypothetical protein
MQLLRLPAVLLFVLPLIATACSSSDSVESVPAANGDTPPVYGSTALITADEGGVLTSDDGLAIFVLPPGALGEDTEISIKGIDVPAGSETIGPAYEIGPDGTTFKIPAALLVDLSAQVGDSDMPVVTGLSIGSDGVLEELPTLMVAGGNGAFSAIAEVTHLSWFSFGPGNGLRFSVDLGAPEQEVGIPWTGALVLGSPIARSRDTDASSGGVPITLTAQHAANEVVQALGEADGSRRGGGYTSKRGETAGIQFNAEAVHFFEPAPRWQCTKAGAGSVWMVVRVDVATNSDGSITFSHDPLSPTTISSNSPGSAFAVALTIATVDNREISTGGSLVTCVGEGAATTSSSTTTSTTSTTVAEIGPSTTLPKGFSGVDIRDFDYAFNSHHFTVTVDGDGESLTEGEGLQWYQANITAETPHGTIRLDYTFGTWGSKGRLFDEAHHPIEGDVTGAWVNPSTLRINLESDLFPSAATSAQVELLVRITDEAGGKADYYSSAEWMQ